LDKNENGAAAPVSIPEFIASIVWSSLFSKHIGKYIQKRTAIAALKSSKKYLYLRMFFEANSIININKFMNG
jgi:hypothetical protein